MMQRTPILASFCVTILLAACAASAASLVTLDPSSVAAFQSGHTVLGFDSLPGNGGGGSAGNTGVPIEPASQVTDNFLSQGVRFSSSGGPAGVVSVQGLINEGDAHSPFNVLAGSALLESVPVLDYFTPIQLDFVCPDSTLPTCAERVGAWNDPTGSRIRLEVFDAGGALLESVEADQGYFLGIQRAGIARAVFSLVSSQGSWGFSLDDVTFSAPSSLLPRLRITCSESNIMLRWSNTAATNFMLEGVDALSGEDWSVVTNAPVVDGADKTVTEPRASRVRFYRLKQP